MDDDRSAEDRPRRRCIRLGAAVYRAGSQTFLVTICTADRHPWFSAHPGLADRATAEIVRRAGSRGTALHAWCVMPDHLHVLLGDRDVREYVRTLKGAVVPHARRGNPGRVLWQRSFHDHALRSGEGVPSAARYVLGNPVRAGIVPAAADYRWSGSLTWPEWRAWTW